MAITLLPILFQVDSSRSLIAILSSSSSLSLPFILCIGLNEYLALLVGYYFSSSLGLLFFPFPTPNNHQGQNTDTRVKNRKGRIKRSQQQHEQHGHGKVNSENNKENTKPINKM